MPQPIRSPAAPAPRLVPLRKRTLAATAAGLAGIAMLAAWMWAQPGIPAAGPLVLPADRAAGIVRRTEVAFADAQGVWDRAVRRDRGSYHKAEVVFFSSAKGTPCAPSPVAGPFYCPESGVAAFDLRFVDTLGERMKRQRDLGIALYAARLSAQHLQRELGLLDVAALHLVGARRGRRAEIGAALALQGDCLAGVWAAAAEPRLGSVPDGFWDQLVWSSRNVVDELRQAGTPISAEFDVFAASDRNDRATAFAEGYAAGQIGGCPLALDGGAAG